MTTSEVRVLNVGAGDIHVTFNPHDEDERTNAVAMLKDMQRRGYAILIRLEDATYTRVLEIDETRGTYVIVAPSEGLAPEAATPEAPVPVLPRRRGRPRRHVPMAGTSVVGVARSAGG